MTFFHRDLYLNTRAYQPVDYAGWHAGRRNGTLHRYGPRRHLTRHGHLATGLFVLALPVIGVLTLGVLTAVAIGLFRLLGALLRHLSGG